MDCRLTLRLLAGLVLVTAGCHKLLPTAAPETPADAMKALAKEPGKAGKMYVEPISEEPVKELKPKTLVALAALREQMAAEIAKTPAEREAFLEDARRAYQQAIATDPKYLPAYLGQASHWEIVGKRDRALTCFDLALQALPNEPSLHFELGMCHARNKDWQLALPPLEKSCELDKANRKYASTYALTLARAERFDESLAALKKLHGPAEAHFLLARMLHHMEKTELCKQHLELALQADPNYKPAQELRTQLSTPPTEQVSATQP